MPTLVAGTTFLVLGDEDWSAGDGATGLYARDARIVQGFRLLIDGQPCRFSPTSSAGAAWCDALGTTAAGQRAHLRVVVAGHCMVLQVRAEQDCQVTVQLVADHTDLFAVKDSVFGELGVDTGEVGGTAGPSPSLDGDGAWATHNIRANSRPDPDSGWLPGAAQWLLASGEQIELSVVWDSGPTNHAAVQHAAADHHDAWMSRFTALPSFLQRSAADLGGLRIDVGGGREVLAAGAPWFMAPFGRDSIIAALQVLSYAPDIAVATAQFLAETQAAEDDPERDAEPGKIMHELRSGAVAARGYDIYYGSVDATPLFVILVDGIAALGLDPGPQVRAAVQRALGWMLARSEQHPLGLISYQRRSARGLDNQSWKDSYDSHTLAEGTLAPTPIAPVEAQAYSIAALRSALAQDDSSVAGRAASLAEHLDEQLHTHMWIGDQECGWYALAVDGLGRPVPSLGSNIGHVLWSGAARSHAARACARHLTGKRLSTGWGVRTLAVDEPGYDPVSYHNGSVWPHDTAICAVGLARYGFRDEARLLAQGLVDAAAWHAGRLPELFSGARRDPNAGPLPYATASSPQAWAAGALPYLWQQLGGLPRPRR